MNEENPSTSSPAPQPPKLNHKRQRAQNHRVRKNAEFLDQLHKDLHERLETNLAIEFAAKAQVKEMGSSTVVPVPVTTRGIGLNIAYSEKYFQYRFPQALIRAAFDHSKLYRFSLMQFKKQLFGSDNLQKRSELYDTAAHPTSVKYEPIIHSVSVQQNFGVVAQSINSVGTFEYNDVIYRCYVPPLKLKVTKKPTSTPEPTMDVDVVETYRPAKRTRPDEQVGTVLTPDPYLVTIDNLRDTVKYLSDPATDEDVRKRFMNYDPLPGSDWNRTNATLKNPDEIMPEGYNEAHFRSDQQAVLNMFANIKARDRAWIGSVPMEGEGSPCILANTAQAAEVEMCEFSTDMVTNLKIDCPELVLRTPLPLTTTHLQLGVLGLMSERPMSEKLGETWSLRSPLISVHQSYYRWDALVDHVLNTMT